MPTIAGTLRASAVRQPDTTALVFQDHRCTYSELDVAVDRHARALSRLGVAKGDRVALMAPNCDGFVIAFYATLRLGAIVVPVSPVAAAPELDYLLRDSGASTLIFAPEVASRVDEARALDPHTQRRFAALGQVTGHDDLPALSAAEESVPVPDVVNESDDALILYTSGTTGRPKGALFDHHRSIWVGVITSTTFGMRIGDRILHVAPLYHAAELCALLVPGTMMAATHVVLGGFEPRPVLSALESERITVFFGVPTMYQLLLQDTALNDHPLPHWRLGLFGAAPMPASAVQRLSAALPDVELMQLCGQTEAGPGGIYSTYSQVKERPDASGRQPLLLTEARVVDTEGNPVSAGQVGELLLRGETIMKGYWNKPEETAATVRDGWLHTGDLVQLDDDGYLTLVDRLKDMIITGGRNVYSVEVENALSAHPSILGCAVVGRPHPVYGESIVAAITLRDGATLSLDEIKAFCADRIAPYKIPHAIMLGPLPRNASGKVLKHQLRAVSPTH